MFITFVKTPLLVELLLNWRLLQLNQILNWSTNWLLLTTSMKNYFKLIKLVVFWYQVKYFFIMAFEKKCLKLFMNMSKSFFCKIKWHYSRGVVQKKEGITGIVIMRGKGVKNLKIEVSSLIDGALNWYVIFFSQVDTALLTIQYTKNWTPDKTFLMLKGYCYWL